MGRLAAAVGLCLVYSVGLVAAAPPFVSAPITSWQPVELPQNAYVGPQDSFPVRATPSPTPTPSAAPRASTKPAPTFDNLGHRIATTATWYCKLGVSRCTAGYDPAGLYAAAGSQVRAALGLHWRGRVVTVCATSCIRVTLIDWDAGPGIDLFASAFRLLSPLSSGRIAVTIRY